MVLIGKNRGRDTNWAKNNCGLNESGSNRDVENEIEFEVILKPPF